MLLQVSLYMYITKTMLLLMVFIHLLSGAISYGKYTRLQIAWSVFEPWLGTLCCAPGETSYSKVLFSDTVAYKWIRVILMLGVALRWTKIPITSRDYTTNTPGRFTLLEPG